MPGRRVVIENPVLNSPFEFPKKHWKFSVDGITDEVVSKRRPSSYFIPIAPPRKRGRGAQTTLDTGWTQDRVRENAWINDVRAAVHRWRMTRSSDRWNVTPTTRRLFEYWTRPGRDKQLFFCQLEAVETIIYITEVAKRSGVPWIENRLREESDAANPGLFRMAMKMATGSGKTVVMAMLIAWHTLNRQANLRDPRFSDTFLVVTPGITIRDRLRVLLPTDPENYYLAWDLVPPQQLEQLRRAQVIVTNFHSFMPRDTVDAARLTKIMLAQGSKGSFTETSDQVVNRVCREFASKKGIVVINDEAHHCYHRKQQPDEEHLTRDERGEVLEREEEARVWSSGLDAVNHKLTVKSVYDLSATPFYLKGSGYPEGTLFPWVVSDFSLIDAIESGIVKVPRVPVSDDQMKGPMPTYRDLWLRIRDGLPRKGKGEDRIRGEPRPPKELEGALESLYGHYKKYYRAWESDQGQKRNGSAPPVFIVVCNNTNVSKLVYDHVAGWEKELGNGKKVIVPGKLELFNNEESGRWKARPNTILIDSAQLESGEPLAPEFKLLVAPSIEEFKNEYRLRFPGRDPESLTDADILREVMNTVGKPGKLGEDVRCVVSVSMLTEGWDANTVTHILGVRAFGTQLLCEQVIGRALRRRSYVPGPDGMLGPEYAEVYGVPFSFIPTSGSAPNPRPETPPTRVRAMPERVACEITFPRVSGYRYEFPLEQLKVAFSKESRMVLSTSELPSKVRLDPIIGESSVHDLGTLKERRLQQVEYVVARRTLERFFRDDNGSPKSWLFPQLLNITRKWVRECLTTEDDAFPQWLLIAEFSHAAAEKIYRSIAIGSTSPKDRQIVALLQPYDSVGSTKNVAFDTRRAVFETDPTRCHLNYVVADTDSWEQRLALALEDMNEVASYVKNQNMGFSIPYTFRGEESNYIPDFIARVKRKDGSVINLILEVTGERRKDKESKVATAREFWVPGVNALGRFGSWDFLEVDNPYDAKQIIRSYLSGKSDVPQKRSEDGE